MIATSLQEINLSSGPRAAKLPDQMQRAEVSFFLGELMGFCFSYEINNLGPGPRVTELANQKQQPEVCIHLRRTDDFYFSSRRQLKLWNSCSKVA